MARNTLDSGSRVIKVRGIPHTRPAYVLTRDPSGDNRGRNEHNVAS